MAEPGCEPKLIYVFSLCCLQSWTVYATLASRKDTQAELGDLKPEADQKNYLRLSQSPDLPLDYPRNWSFGQLFTSHDLQMSLATGLTDMYGVWTGSNQNSSGPICPFYRWWNWDLEEEEEKTCQKCQGSFLAKASTFVWFSRLQAREDILD